MYKIPAAGGFKIYTPPPLKNALCCYAPMQTSFPLMQPSFSPPPPHTPKHLLHPLLLHPLPRSWVQSDGHQQVLRVEEGVPYHSEPAQQRYFSYRAILVAILVQNSLVLVLWGISHKHLGVYSLSLACEGNEHRHISQFSEPFAMGPGPH